MDMNLIKETLALIKDQTGLRLELCDYFTGINHSKGKSSFNVILKERISESLEYDKLEKWAKKYNKIQIEPNGLNRVAIFIQTI